MNSEAIKQALANALLVVSTTAIVYTTVKYLKKLDNFIDKNTKK